MNKNCEKCPPQEYIYQFIKGIYGDRKNPVSEKQVRKSFEKYYPEFKGNDFYDFLDELLSVGRIIIRPRSLSSSRRWNGAYVYEVAA